MLSLVDVGYGKLVDGLVEDISTAHISPSWANSSEQLVKPCNNRVTRFVLQPLEIKRVVQVRLIPEPVHY